MAIDLVIGERSRTHGWVDAASLAAFRIAFGALMLIAVGRYFAYGWIEQMFISPRVYFPYPGLEWIAPLPPWAMYALFIGLGACALGIALGACYRLSAVLFCVGFTYAHLIDRTNYLNHYYLISLLAFLLVFIPAHRSWSVDGRHQPPTWRNVAPSWAVWLLRFQLAIVYCFGAIAKLNTDWLVRAQPLRIWLGANIDLPIIGPWLESAWVAFACSYAGLLFDAAIVPLLLWRRTRTAAYVAVLVFHLLTAVLFPIGMFPWLMIGLTPIFFAPSWPRDCLRRVGAAFGRGAEWLALPDPPPAQLPPRRAYGTAIALASYAFIQIAMPLRHLAGDGDLYWSESGFRWAWQIMVMEKYGQAAFLVTDPATQHTERIAPADELTPLQARMMATQPDMIVSYAHHLARLHHDRIGHAVQVRAEVRTTLNGRAHQPLIDPSIDLATLPVHTASAAVRSRPWAISLRNRAGNVMVDSRRPTPVPG